MSRYNVALPVPVPVAVEVFTYKEDSVQKGETAIATHAAYGFDHAIGLFVQLWAADGQLIVDRDGLFGGLTQGPMLQAIQDYGIPMPAAHRNAISLDLEF